MLKGDVAQACRQTQTLLAPPSPLLIKDVFSALRKIRYECPYWFWFITVSLTIELIKITVLLLGSSRTRN